MQRIGIIGAGRFGEALAMWLVQKGAEVLLMDSSRDKVKRLSSVVTRAAQGDATNADALREAGFTDCNAVVVAIGENLEASVLATIMLKELEVPQIIAKAASDVHGRVLQRVGADRVVYPERDVARRLARSLWAPTVLDYFEMSDGVSIMEMEAPEEMFGKTLAEAKIRNVMGLTVLAVKRTRTNGETERIVAPPSDAVIRKGDSLTVFGTDKNLEKLHR